MESNFLREILLRIGDVVDRFVVAKSGQIDIEIVDLLPPIRDRKRYDVIVTTNMFGDIITDLSGIIQGGMGVAAGNASIVGVVGTVKQYGLDVDGRIGGYNFQWAWASGYVVGSSSLSAGMTPDASR